MYQFDTPKELIEKLVTLIETERKRQKYTQVQLSQKADIPTPTYREFLYKYKISLESLFKVFVALGMYDNIDGLLTQRRIKTLDDIRNSNTRGD